MHCPLGDDGLAHAGMEGGLAHENRGLSLRDLTLGVQPRDIKYH